MPTPIYAPTPSPNHQQQHAPAQCSPEHHRKCNTNPDIMLPTPPSITRSLTRPLGPSPSRCSPAASSITSITIILRSEGHPNPSGRQITPLK